MPFDAIALSAGDSQVEVVPERGAIVTSVVVAGRELLYLDRATLDDPGANVRGGIPILFPFAGQLEGDRFVVPATPTTMKQHGFGRQRPWHPRHGPRAADHVNLGLPADDATRAVYPYELELRYRVQVLERGVALLLAVHNRGDTPMPIAPGWHPYFRCADKSAVRSDLATLDPTRFTPDREFDFGLANPDAATARFELPEVGRIAIAVEGLRYWQFWSLPGKPFVCLEPFAGPPGLINGPARDEVPPGGSRSYGVSITLE